MTTKTPADITAPHYADLNGRIACREHIGYAASAYLEAHPDATEIDTELTSWERLGARDKFYLAKEFGTKVLCETCRSLA